MLESPKASSGSRPEMRWCTWGYVGLSERMLNRPSQLSGGQQQRGAIARALFNRPALVLADEPTGGLDTQTSSEGMNLLTHLNHQGITIVLLTHEPDVAAWAHHTIRVSDGLLISSEAGD